MDSKYSQTFYAFPSDTWLITLSISLPCWSYRKHVSNNVLTFSQTLSSFTCIDQHIFKHTVFHLIRSVLLSLRLSDTYQDIWISHLWHLSIMKTLGKSFQKKSVEKNKFSQTQPFNHSRDMWITDIIIQLYMTRINHALLIIS